MNCREFEQKVLLAQSGELGRRGRRALERHRERCDRCRAYGETAAAFVEAARLTLTGEPGAEALNRIRTRAAARARSPAMLFYRPGIQGLAWAAALLLAVGGGWLIAPRNGEIGLHDMNVIITMMMDEEMMMGQPGAKGEATDLRALADLLLRMEEAVVNGSTDQEEQPGELDSRVPRSRSSPEAPLRRYG